MANKRNVINLTFPKLRFLLLMSILTVTISYLNGEEILRDLEQNIQDFVLDTKRIHIPGFPNAFNPAIVNWNGRNLLSFRVLPNPKDSYTSCIGVVWLDDEFNPIGQAQLLNTRMNGLSDIPPRSADARMIAIEDSVYIVYEDNTEKLMSRGGFRVYVTELVLDDDTIRIKEPECLALFEGADRNVREKSWVPFVYQNNLLLAYTINPHLIFYPLLGTNSCETICKSAAKISWPWGELRGGTQALKVDDQHYLAFFHSSILLETVHSGGKKITHYFMGAYLFDAEPPFALTHTSTEPIFSLNFYSGIEYKPHWKPIKAIFPCGYILDEEYIWIAYGRDDYECWLVKLDKQKLIDSLVPVQ